MDQDRKEGRSCGIICVGHHHDDMEIAIATKRVALAGRTGHQGVTLPDNVGNPGTTREGTAETLNEDAENRQKPLAPVLIVNSLPILPGQREENTMEAVVECLAEIAKASTFAPVPGRHEDERKGPLPPKGRRFPIPPRKIGGKR